MNLPETAIEFLDAFQGLFSLSSSSERDLRGAYETLPMVHCHCFTRFLDPDEARADIVKVAKFLPTWPVYLPLFLFFDREQKRRWGDHWATNTHCISCVLLRRTKKCTVSASDCPARLRSSEYNLWTFENSAVSAEGASATGFEKFERVHCAGQSYLRPPAPPSPPVRPARRRAHPRHPATP